MLETYSVSLAGVIAVFIIIAYLAYKGPNRLYKRELEIVSATLRKSVRETVGHNRGNVEAWLLIAKLVKGIPTESADFTVGYLISNLENDLIYKQSKKDVYEYRHKVSTTLKLIRALKYSFEIDISKNPNISRIAIPKKVVIKTIKKLLESQLKLTLFYAHDCK